VKAQLDHLVIDVHDRLDEGEKRWKALGFHVTPRGRHSLGSANHLIILGTDYLELLGWEKGPARADLVGFPIGLNGLVFRDWDHRQTYAEMQKNGVPVTEPRSFHRPVELEDGSIAGDAKFTTTRLEPRTGFDGRTYFCQHDTPELVWREEWRKHPNSAYEVYRVVIAAADPAKPMGVLNAMFGTVSANVLPLAKARVEAVPHATLGAQLPEAGGRGDYLALIGFRVRSLAACEAALKAGGISYTKEGATLRVAPAQTMNVALEFTE
jgi:Glyoxalase-like domain